MLWSFNYVKQTDTCKLLLIVVTNNHKDIHFENVANIAVDGDSITPQKKKIGERKIVRFLLKKMRQLKV